MLNPKITVANADDIPRLIDIAKTLAASDQPVHLVLPLQAYPFLMQAVPKHYPDTKDMTPNIVGIMPETFDGVRLVFMHVERRESDQRLKCFVSVDHGVTFIETIEAMFLTHKL